MNSLLIIISVVAATMLGLISNIVAAIIQPTLQPRKRLVYSLFTALLVLVIGLTLASANSGPGVAQQPSSPIAGPARTATAQERDEWKQAEALLRTALADENAYLSNIQASGMAWGSAGQMRQLAGKRYFVGGEVPQGGGTVSVVISGDPNDHPDDVLYLGARVGQRDVCIYAREAVSRASASVSPALVWAVASPCVRPHEPTAWRRVDSPLELIDAVPH
jgi:hypothetical protein